MRSIYMYLQLSDSLLKITTIPRILNSCTKNMSHDITVIVDYAELGSASYQAQFILHT